MYQEISHPLWPVIAEYPLGEERREKREERREKKKKVSSSIDASLGEKERKGKG